MQKGDLCRTFKVEKDQAMRRGGGRIRTCVQKSVNLVFLNAGAWRILAPHSLSTPKHKIEPFIRVCGKTQISRIKFGDDG